MIFLNVLISADEPTNNLDAVGIAFLTEYIQQTDKTCVVISHDEDFLNSFSDSVLYLDVFSHKVYSSIFEIGLNIKSGRYNVVVIYFLFGRFLNQNSSLFFTISTHRWSNTTVIITL